MKIGYPCIHRSIGCTANASFRLSSYSEEKLIKVVSNNLDCLMKILQFNVKHKLKFFRITSKLVPFASHPICKFDWENYFKTQFEEIGKFIKKNNIRISMHPDQFILINAKDKNIVEKSVKELEYHCKLLDAMQLSVDAKIQIHVGGVYNDKKGSIYRFVKTYEDLSSVIKKRLVIENDEYKYNLLDCINISAITKVPVVFDSFHHECFNNGESIRDAAKAAANTWQKKDGLLMIDYSSQKKGKRKGAHAEHIDIRHFKNFLKEIKGIECDIMLEIKDKEVSALKAVKYL